MKEADLDPAKVTLRKLPRELLLRADLQSPEAAQPIPKKQ